MEKLDWSQILRENLVDWLLEESNPSIRYLTLHDLLDKSEDDSEVTVAKEAITKSPVVMEILAKQSSKGYWEEPANPYRSKYKSSHWQIMVLGQLGMDNTDERVRKACNTFSSFNWKKAVFRATPRNER